MRTHLHNTIHSLFVQLVLDNQHKADDFGAIKEYLEKVSGSKFLVNFHRETDFVLSPSQADFQAKLEAACVQYLSVNALPANNATIHKLCAFVVDELNAGQEEEIDEEPLPGEEGDDGEEWPDEEIEDEGGEEEEIEEEPVEEGEGEGDEEETQP